MVLFMSFNLFKTSEGKYFADYNINQNIEIKISDKDEKSIWTYSTWNYQK